MVIRIFKRLKHTETKYITAPIFYVNSVPHIGHLYTAVLGDTFKRWYEFKGYKTMYSVGTDEHGLKIQQAAESAGTPPQQFCDTISQEFKKLFEKANISYTDYIRTSEPRHYEAVSHLWKTLWDKGYIYKGYHEGWYSVSDETFVPESQVEETEKDGKIVHISKESGKIVEWTKEENYKFRLKDMQKQLVEWLESDLNLIVPQRQYIDTLKNMKSSEIADLSVSRLASKVSWGIPVPNDPSHVIYVWLDALTNYLTVDGYPEKADGWPATLHVVGKDIIKFHAIYWPAFLMAAGLPLPQKILSHGHWLIDNQKMSKSSGNGVDPYALLDEYGVDAIRYFLVRDGGIGIDPEFTLLTVWRRYKHDLMGQLGNIVMRASSKKINPTSKIPTSLNESPLSQEESDILEKCKMIAAVVEKHVEQGRISDGLIVIADLVSDLNKYWTVHQPWNLVKDKSELGQARLSNVMHITFESIRIAALLLQPVMPEKMKLLLDQLQVPQSERYFQNAQIGGCTLMNRSMEPGFALFKKIEGPQV